MADSSARGLFTLYPVIKMKLYLAVFFATLLAPLISSAQSSQSDAVTASSASAERSFAADTLSEARAGFLAAYGFSAKDCDPIQSEWVCSEFNVTSTTLLSLTEPSIEGEPANESVSTCTAYGSNQQGAQDSFSVDCPWRIRNFCGLSSTGEWACSTEVFTSSISEPADTINLAESSCITYGASLSDAQASFSTDCPWRDRNFCNPLSSDEWACSTDFIQTWTNVLDALSTTNTTVSTTTTSAASSGNSPGTGVVNPSYQSGDLILIAHDSGPDTDDMQAIVANRMIINAYPDVNFIMIGATQGHAWTTPTAGSENHTQSLFPSWINAKASTSGTASFDGTSVIAVADHTEQTLGNGGTVHIAEGGPSDFTAEVIRVLQSRGVSATDLKRIRVVQHSAGTTAWNEQQTSSSNIALVKSASTWVPIANGNVGGNATADFQEPASSAMCQRFMNAASATQYASQWAWAYSKIGDTRKCDQSDSVELLYILNDTSTKTFDQFSSRYM